MVFELASLDEVGTELGQRLRAHRIAHNIQQAELAERAGVSLGTIRHLETKGLCSMASFLKVVRALGLLHELSALFQSQPTTLAELERRESTKLRVRRSKP